MDSNILIWAVTFLVLLYIFLIASFIFLERRSPVSTVSWLLIFVVFSYLGIVIYFFLGRDMSKKKVFKLYQEEKDLMREIKSEEAKADQDGSLDLRIDGEMSELIHLNNQTDDENVTFNNKVDFLLDGAGKFASLEADLENAEEEINMLYFIYKNDNLGRTIRDILIRKAEEGIKVRLLLDDVGSRRVKGKFFEELRKAGGMVSFSFPAPLYFNVNNRNHRKITVIDRKTAYIGGFNIGDEYLGLSSKMGYWRDSHLRIQGSSINSILVRFILDWRNAGNKDFVIDNDTFKRIARVGNTGIQIISSGPDTKLNKIKLAYMEMIHQAKKTIYIQTPYFVPDEAFMESLKMALLKGVEVKMMIPNKKDHIFVYWATYSYIGDLLPYGLKAYSYNNGFLHAKTIMIDSKILSVGSANLDERSFKLSFECNAFLYGKETGSEYEEIFRKDLEFCTEITKEIYQKRSLGVKLKEAISRLISPIL